MDGASRKILLIDGSPDDARLARSWIAGSARQFAFALTCAETLEAGLRHLAIGGIDVILLNLALPDSSGLQTFAAIRTKAPGVPIIVLSDANSEALTLQTIHKGAEDYLVRSGCSPELFGRVVESAIVRHKARETGAATRIVGVLGAAGGAGTTTIACNLAAELRRQTGEKVLLADLDLHTGLVPFVTGLTNTATFSIRDAVENLHRLDQSCWDNMVLRGPGDLQIVPAPDLLGNGDLSPEALMRVLNRIKPFYQWVVLDLGRLNTCAMGMLEAVDDLLVVTTTTVPSLYGAILVVNALKGAGFTSPRMRLVVNQSGKSQALSAGEIDKLFGIETIARLPAAPREMEEAYEQKKLPAETTLFRKQVAILARKIAGLPVTASATASGARRVGLLRWFAKGIGRARVAA